MNKKMYGMLSLAILLSTAACSSADDLQLAKTEITVEYGDPLSLDPKDYLIEDTAEDILHGTSVKVFIAEGNNKKNEPLDTDGTGLEVGSYILSLSYKDETEDVKVNIEDTTAPEFVNFTEKVILIQGESTDLTKLFQVKDLSAVEVTVEGEVDFDTVGKYPVTFIAKDKYENMTEKECVIQIDEKPKEIIPVIDTMGNDSPKNSESTFGLNSATSAANSNASSNSSHGSVTTQPIQPEPAPMPHQHKFVVNDTTTYYEGSELLFNHWNDAVAKSTDIQYELNGETWQKWGLWKNVSVFGVRCSNGCDELWYAVELIY
ncbi:hypothetical protein [uncultured Traorella sp.]|uniref:hypothetical protein n=1 Tax=uncultured Traorella sp. TaxID=1929048 RepID=UPI0025F01A02|nr:hypothetical protein [uncultured Traorella sp.]